MEVKMTTDKNGRDINVGDYVQVINRITGSVENSGFICKIEDKKVFLRNYIDIECIEMGYFQDEIIKQY